MKGFPPTTLDLGTPINDDQQVFSKATSRKALLRCDSDFRDRRHPGRGARRHVAGAVPSISRIARIGSWFVLLYRFDGERWVVAHLDQPSLLGRYGGMPPGLIENPRLGRTVQAGVTAMTDWDTIRARYQGLSPSAPFKTFNATVVKPPDGHPDLRARFKYVRFRPVTVPTPLAGRRLADLAAPDFLSFLGD